MPVTAPALLTKPEANPLSVQIQREEFAVILQRAYAAYGLSVVTDRALPDARDGLKPVQRRILYGMLTRRYLSSRPTVKSAEIVGGILGDYHPHGDSSVYDAMVRLAQDFTLRYPLIEGQGNFGSLDNDPAAAYRYTEARLSPLAEALMADIEKETVSLHPTYKQDPRVLEPDYLPGRIPPVVNPSSGIAVGLSTNILPHNLGEVVSAAIGLIANPAMTVKELMAHHIKGPDFPGGAVIVNSTDGIRDYLTTGKGRVVVRSVLTLEENPRTRKRAWVVTAIGPVGRDKVKASIIKAVNDRKLDGMVPDVRDESDTEHGTRIVLELKKDTDPAQLLEQLYRETDLETAVTAQMVFLFGEPMEAARQPKQVGMIELLNCWNTHQLDVLRRRTQYELTRAQERLHIVEGLIIGSANAEGIVRIFQEADNREEARATIAARYQLSERQVEVIANMTLSQVTRLDAGKYEQEKEELLVKITYLQGLLADGAMLVALFKKELFGLVKQFGDKRRTQIIASHTPITSASTSISASSDSDQSISTTPTTAEVANSGSQASLAEAGRIASQTSSSTSSTTNPAAQNSLEQPEIVLYLYHDGTIKAVPKEALANKNGNGGKSPGSDDRGVLGGLTKGEEGLALAPVTSSPVQHLLFFTDKGRVFGLAAKNVPQGTRTGKGESLRRFLQLGTSEQVVSLISVSTPHFKDESGFFVSEFTRSGKVKKVPLAEYRTADEKGIADFKLVEANDAVIAALLLDLAASGSGNPAVTPRIRSGEYLVTTDQGQTLRFSDEDVRVQAGRVGQGVVAIKLGEVAGHSPSKVVSVHYLSGTTTTTDTFEERVQANTQSNQSSNEIGWELLVMTALGAFKRVPLNQYPAKGRATGGVVTVDLSPVKGRGPDRVVQTFLVEMTELGGQTISPSTASNAQPNPTLLLTSTKGQTLTLDLAQVPRLNRAGRGQILLKLDQYGAALVNGVVFTAR